MIDTHAHIYLPQFSENIHEILERAEQVGVSAILLPGIHEVSWEQMNALPKHTSVSLHKMFGIHPCDVDESINHYDALLFKYASRDDVIGIGETGLDYYWSVERVFQQKESLKIHCKIAKELNKPIVLHNRESTTDLLDIIEREQDGRLRGVWHCFTGTIDEGKRALDLGLKLGIGGVVTFKNAGVDKTVKELPLSSFMLETDSPYLSPVPHRGKPNEPSYLFLIANKMADLFEVDVQTIIDSTNLQARALFNI